MNKRIYLKERWFLLEEGEASIFSQPPNLKSESAVYIKKASLEISTKGKMTIGLVSIFNISVHFY